MQAPCYRAAPVTRYPFRYVRASLLESNESFVRYIERNFRYIERRRDRRARRLAHFPLCFAAMDEVDSRLDSLLLGLLGEGEDEGTGTLDFLSIVEEFAESDLDWESETTDAFASSSSLSGSECEMEGGRGADLPVDAPAVATPDPPASPEPPDAPDSSHQ